MVFSSNHALLSCHREWRPQLHLVGGIGSKRELKFRAHNSDHGMSLPIEGNVLPHDVRIGSKLVAPEALAEDHYVFMAGLVFFRRKHSAQKGLGLKNREKVARYFSRSDELWFAFARQVKRPRRIDRGIFEN